MNEVTEALLEGLREREEAVGSSFTWAGQEFPCSGGAELGGRLLGEGGFRVTAQVTLVARLELFDGAARPQERQSLVYKSVPGAAGKELRIASVTVLYEAVLVIEGNDPRQGA